jgi:uncharacterized damage-inducible protein DinB
MNLLHIKENDSARTRIADLIVRLTDDEINRSVSPDWTVGVALMHVAFWDRQWLLKLDEFERTGEVHIPPMNEFVHVVNEWMLPWWRAFSPAQVRRETISAAEEIDRKIANLPENLTETILSQRPRSVNRAIHRNEHADEIEHMLAS